MDELTDACDVIHPKLETIIPINELVLRREKGNRRSEDEESNRRERHARDVKSAMALFRL